jgi:predicted transporter
MQWSDLAAISGTEWFFIVWAIGGLLWFVWTIRGGNYGEALGGAVMLPGLLFLLAFGLVLELIGRLLGLFGRRDN